jgi:organic radical activating enzyme
MMLKACGYQGATHVYFSWHLTDWCNYKCKYCPVLDVITNDFTVDRHANEFRLVIARLKTVTQNFDICLSGGEPTLHPHLLEIVTELDKIENCKTISIFTNMTRPSAYFKKFAEIESTKLSVLGSYHPTYYSDKFIQRSIELDNMEHINYRVHLNMVDDQETWDTTEQMINEFKSTNVNYKINVLQSNGNWQADYSPEFYERFLPYMDDKRKHDASDDIRCEFEDGHVEYLKDYEIEVRDLNRFKGYACTPLYYNISITGEVTNMCTRRVVPLNLKNNLIKLESCPLDACHSRQMLDFYKEKK